MKFTVCNSIRWQQYYKFSINFPGVGVICSSCEDENGFGI
jgi:hypothetical protein